MNNILRNITPAVVVMVAGLAGAYLVYDNFFTNADGEIVADISPAAGEMTDDTIIVSEDTTTPVDATTSMAAPAMDAPAAVTETPVVETPATLETTTTDVTTTTTTEIAPVPVPVPDCTSLEMAATAAMGTVDAEKTQKAVTECLAAKAAAQAQGAASAAAVASDAATNADAAAQTAVDAAADADAAAADAHDAATDAKKAAE